MNLDCLNSELEISHADCIVTYQTAENRKVEITLGAASGPGCLTNFKGLVGPPSDKTVFEYARPKNALDTGPEYLQSWEQTFRSYMNLTEPTTAPDPELENPPVTEAPAAVGLNMVAVPDPVAVAPSQ